MSSRPHLAVLPTPIAELYYRLLSIGDEFPDAMERTAGLLFEAFVQYSASVVIGAYLRTGSRDKGMDGLVRSLQGDPTLGLWLNCLDTGVLALAKAPCCDNTGASVRAVVRDFTSTDLTEPMRRFGDVVHSLRGQDDGISVSEPPFDDLRGFLRYAVDYRNQKAHGGARWLERNIGRLVGPLSESVLSLIDCMPWLGTPLFRTESVEATGPSFVHRGEYYVGPVRRRCLELPLSHRLPDGVLVFDPEGDAVPLAPFYVVMSCKACFGPRVCTVLGDVGKPSPRYGHLDCGWRAEAPCEAEAWRTVLRPRAETSPEMRSVSCEASVTPQGRPVFMGEEFTVRFVVRNPTHQAVRAVALDLPMPEATESLQEKAAVVPVLASGRQAEFEYCLRSFHEGSLVIPATLTYRVGDGSEVVRPVGPQPVLVVFNEFPGMVGRRRELAAVEQTFSQVLTGRARTVLIEGDTGLGKTVLAEEFLRRLADTTPGTTILRAHCSDDDGDPFSPIKALLVGYLQVLRCRSLAAQQSDAATLQLSGLLELVANASREGGQSGLMFADALTKGGEGQQANLYAATLAALSQACSGGPLVLFVDELQHMHGDAWKLMKYLMRQLARQKVLLLACVGPQCTRSECLGGLVQPREIVELAREGTRVQLTCLSIRERFELIDLLLSGNAFAAGQKEAIAEFSQGIPAWLIEAVRVLRADQRIVRRDGWWCIEDESKDLAIDRAFSDMIRSRYESLSPELQRLVENAAVLGNRFSREMLLALPLGKDNRFVAVEVNALLRQLKEIHHILKDGESDLEFAHARIREIVYNTMDPALRKEAHRYAASVLEARQDPERWCRELASHFLHAGEHDKALHYLDLLANRHAANLAYEEAARVLERAIGLASGQGDANENWVFDAARRLARFHVLAGNVQEAMDLDEKNVERGRTLRRYRETCKIYRALSALHQRHGRLLDARRTLRAGQLLASTHGIVEAEHAFEMQLAVIARKEGSLDEAERLLTTCSAYADGAGSDWLRAECARNLGVVLRQKGEIQRGLTQFAKASLCFERLTGSARSYGLATTYGNLARLSLQAGQLRSAEAQIQKSLVHWHQVGDIMGLSRALRTQAEILFQHGQVDDARAKIAESVDLKRRLEDQEGLARCRELEGAILAEQDDWEGSIAAYQEAVVLFDKVGAHSRAARARCGIVRVKSASCSLENARDDLSVLRGEDKARWDAPALLDYYVVEADYARRTGDHPTALEFLAKIDESIDASVDVAQSSQADFVRALVLVSTQQLDQARKVLEQGVEREAQWGNAFMQAKYRLLLAKTHRLLGHHDVCIQRASEILEPMRTIGDPLGEAMALDEIGSSLLELGRPGEARGNLERALAIKQNLGDKHRIERSRKLLARCEEMEKANG
jgi:tetratricopeptide (TPR) repeat protein